VYLSKAPSLVSLLKARLVARLAYLKKKAKKDLLLSNYEFILVYKEQVISSLSQIINYIKKVLEELKPELIWKANTTTESVINSVRDSIVY